MVVFHFFREMCEELYWDLVFELSEAYYTDHPTIPTHASELKRHLLTTGWRSHIELYLSIKYYTKSIYQVTITQRITIM
jgi:hypothetical protein